jgi:hypothetical protein
MNVRHLILCVLAAATGCKTIATYTLKTTGAIAETTIKVGGAVTKTAINTTFDIAGAAFKKGAVTVIDTTTGVSKKVPWEKGLDVYAASQSAQIKTATRTLEIVRGTKKIQATAQTPLNPGDVLHLK